MNIGDAVGNFRIIAQLGSGGMGEVFLAEQPNIDTKVAIKVLRREISRDMEHVQRFFNEARAVGKIKHAGIVKIFEGGFLPSGNAFLMMEFLEGESLAARIRRVGQLSIASVCDLGRQIASVLAATHAVGITHRDLKPDNIFIVPDAELANGERVKILDFGIAKLTGTLASGPRTVGTMGTPAYMAPEQWGDSASVDWRADAYSLGCVLFEMVCGRPPFLGDSFADLCGKHLTVQPPAPTAIGVALPASLEQLILRLLAKDASARASSLADVGRELDAIGRSADAFPPPPARVAMASDVPPTLHTHGSPPASSGAAPGSSGVPALGLQAGSPSTTLGGAAGEVRPARRGRGVMLAGAALAIVGAGVAVVVTLRSGDHGAGPRAADAAVAVSAGDAAIDARDDVAASDAAATGAGDAGIATTTMSADAARAAIVERNPFAVDHANVQQHAITRGEYALYLAALGPAERTLQQPLVATAAASDDEPQTGLSHDRARRFCRWLDADLPTRLQWLRATAVPVQEWTAHVDNSLALVVGAHRDMTATERADALREPLRKETEAAAGTSIPEVVAGARIGFRCARVAGPKSSALPAPAP